MRSNRIFCAALIISMMPGVAMADDPKDPVMRDAAARARDAEITRQLNRREGEAVRQRDARYARGWRAARGYAARSREHERAMANYARSRSQYEREMAEWRRAVAACRAGNYSACDD